MKRLLSLLLAVCMLLTLAACSGTQADPTDAPTTAPTTGPTEPTFPDGRIVIQAEKPSEFTVDLEDRLDVNGLPMYQPGDQPHSARPIAEDGLQYCTRSTTCIIFCTFDTYTYTFDVKEAGSYSFRVLGSCDRDSPLDFKINGKDDYGFFVRNDYMGYDEVELSTVELVEGTNTITITISENKNHNFWVDCYYLVPVTE